MIYRESKNKRKRNRKTDAEIKKTYYNWKPIKDINRSFFLWMGKFSDSPKEKEIVSILKEMNLRYFREVSFDLVKRFDFYIPLIDLVIEYDGVQHFSYLKQINNDIRKDNILKKLGIKCIRYNKSHRLKEQITHDLLYHPILMQ